MQAETLRDAANVLLIVGLILAACGTFGVNYFRSKVERERAETAKVRDNDTVARAEALQLRVDELVTGKNELLVRNSELAEHVKTLGEELVGRESTIQQLRGEIAAVRKYSYAATLTFNGMVYTGGDITMPTPIPQAVEGTWREIEPGRFRPVCESAAFAKSRGAIQ